MKKFLLVFGALLLGAAGYLGYKFYWEETQNLNAIYLIPKDAVYVISTEDPIGNWKEIRKSAIWEHLRTNRYFAELTSSANTLDTLLRDNEMLFDLVGSKRLLVSAHTISSHKFDHLFVVDLAKTAKFAEFKTLLKKIISQGFSLTERSHKGIDILELLDKKTNETLYMAFINNNLVMSYTGKLVEASIEQKDEPTLGRDQNFIEVSQKTGNSKMIRMYVQYAYMDEFAAVFDFTDQPWINKLSQSLYFTGIDADLIGGNEIIAKGFSNLNEINFSYLLAMQNSGTGSHDIAKVAPLRTGTYISFGFESYSKFYDNYMSILERNPEEYQSVMDNKEQIEKLLKIDMKKNFIDWIDDEIGFLKYETETFGPKNDFALVIKAKSAGEAKDNLDFIAEQVRKRTPVKFKEVDYKGYTISFMSVKGFFKFFLGGFFKKLDTPYFTIIDDYVVFTNSPNSLKYVIDNYIDGKVLQQSAYYKSFKKNFEDQSNVFVYVNTPRYYESFASNFAGQTKADLMKNRTYFTGFTQIGLQLFPQNEMFKNILAVKFVEPNIMEQQPEFQLISEDEDEFDDGEEIIAGVSNDTIITIPEINPDDFNAKEFKYNYTTGELRYEVELKDGKKHGLYKEYYRNGELKLKGKFKDDYPKGTWKKYDTIGNLIVKKKWD
jgi:antitoxin component YwqK of YwqJK toxin-antitoxin module